MNDTNDLITATKPRSHEELGLRYLRFCLQYELDETLHPEEQSRENAAQQKWLDNHVSQRRRVDAGERFFDAHAIAHIQHDLMERFDVEEHEILAICGHIEDKPSMPLPTHRTVIGNLTL